MTAPINQGTQGSLRSAAGGNQSLGIAPQRTAEDVSASAGTPSPMRQSIAAGLMEMGFTNLGMATGNPASAMATSQFGQTVADALRSKWHRKESMDFTNREGAWYSEQIQAAGEAYSWATTPVVGPDGKPGIPDGPPGPDGQPTGLISTEDPKAGKIYQMANNKMAQTTMQLTLQYYNMAQQFKENPLIQENVRGIMVAQAGFMNAVTNRFGEGMVREAQAEGRAGEKHTAEMGNIEAQTAERQTGADLNRAQIRVLDREGSKGSIADDIQDIVKNHPAEYNEIQSQVAETELDATLKLMVDKGDAEDISDAREKFNRTEADMREGSGITPDEKLLGYVKKHDRRVRTMSMSVALETLKDRTPEEIRNSKEVSMFSPPPREVAPEKKKETEPEDKPGILGRAIDIGSKVSVVNRMLRDPTISNERSAELQLVRDALQRARMEEFGAIPKALSDWVKKRDTEQTITRAKEEDEIIKLGEKLRKEEEQKQKEQEGQTPVRQIRQ